MANKPKLSCVEAYSILIDIVNGLTTIQISEKYNISRGTIHNIVYGKTYEHCGFSELNIKARTRLTENRKNRWKKMKLFQI